MSTNQVVLKAVTDADVVLVQSLRRDLQPSLYASRVRRPSTVALPAAEMVAVQSSPYPLSEVQAVVHQSQAAVWQSWVVVLRKRAPALVEVPSTAPPLRSLAPCPVSAPCRSSVPCVLPAESATALSTAPASRFVAVCSLLARCRPPFAGHDALSIPPNPSRECLPFRRFPSRTNLAPAMCSRSCAQRQALGVSGDRPIRTISCNGLDLPVWLCFMHLCEMYGQPACRVESSGTLWTPVVLRLLMLQEN